MAKKNLTAQTAETVSVTAESSVQQEQEVKIASLILLPSMRGLPRGNLCKILIQRASDGTEKVLSKGIVEGTNQELSLEMQNSISKVLQSGLELEVHCTTSVNYRDFRNAFNNDPLKAREWSKTAGVRKQEEFPF